MNEKTITKLTIFSYGQVVKIVAVGENGCARISHFATDGAFYAFNDKDELIFEAKNINSYMIDYFDRNSL